MHILIYFAQKKYISLPVNILVLRMNAGNRLQYNSENSSMSIYPSSSWQKNIGRDIGIICRRRI